ncbi:hypothetical protein H6778_00105 [Candidatus Nomurabacteria bacterium]|nr:hypothetical protein [Candidatus Nomurabacteria bacterium]
MTHFATLARTIKPACVVAIIWVMCALPSLVLAQDGINVSVTNHTPFSSIEGLLVAILRIFITIATPIIIMFIIYAGFLYVTARGNAQQTQQATRALTYAVIGGVLVLGAVALSEVIKGTVEAFKS